MNIFFLSMSIIRCAKYHFDKHVIKMILEYTLLLSTAWHVLSVDATEHLNNGLIYRPTHKNHPCAIWVRLHINNYLYVCKLGLQLCREWRYRYNHNKIHACEDKLLFMLHNHPPINNDYIRKDCHNPKSLLLPLPQAMPLEYKSSRNTVHRTIKAYRLYYKSPCKNHLTDWTKKRNDIKIKMDKPPWW